MLFARAITLIFLLTILVITAIIVFGYFFVFRDKKPNVIIIIADDMGSYDASYRGSNQFITPNIDALAYHGIIFDRFYTPPMCTPSRSSVMTGKYPHTIGMQNYVIKAVEPFGLGLDEKLMSDYFHEAGYATHLVGKWHLGYFSERYTPTYRGFDSFFGYYNGLIDYYNYTYIEDDYVGYDFRQNEKSFFGMNRNAYATDLFNDEAVNIIKSHDNGKPLFLMLNSLAPHTGNDYQLLQAPQEEISKFRYIDDSNRQVLAAMVSKLDEGVGKIVDALQREGMLENSIILFLSDNGAPSAGMYDNSGSNYPLRGQKQTPWEGASRNLGLIYSPLIKASSRIEKGYFHTSDILPTLASAAGIKVPNVEGYDQWKYLVNNQGTPQRYEIVTAMDNIEGYSGLIQGRWKLVNGSLNPLYDFHLGAVQEFPISDENYIEAVISSPAHQALKKQKTLDPIKIVELRRNSKIHCNQTDNPFTFCEPNFAPCLFNIIDDPCEMKNLASLYPDTMREMQERLRTIVKYSAPSRRVQYKDPKSNPLYHKGTWSPWILEREH